MKDYTFVIYSSGPSQQSISQVAHIIASCRRSMSYLLEFAHVKVDTLSNREARALRIKSR